MRRIIYKTLRGSNFLSIGNEQVVIDFKSGLNLITGDNLDNPERKNALGKSAMCELFYFALFGKTIREIKRDFIVNNITKGKGLAELEFDVETEQEITSYTIKRQVKPSMVTLLRGTEDITKDSIANTDKFICDLIGSNSVICRSCDILSLSDNVPFMAKKAEDKRKFINDIFSLEVFGLMMKDLKKLVQENNTDMGVSSAKLAEINNTLESFRKTQEEYEKKVREREVILEQKRKEWQDKITSMEYQISQIPEKVTDEWDEQIQKLHDAWTLIDGKIANVLTRTSSEETLERLKEAEIKAVSSVSGVKCYTCLQDIPHTHTDRLKVMEAEFKSQLLSIVENLNNLKIERKSWEDKKGQVQDKIRELKEIVEEINSTNRQIERLKDTLKQHQENLANLASDDLKMPSFDLDIVSVEDRKTTETANLALLKQRSEDLEVCKFVLGDDGVKSFVVKRLLNMLNGGIQQYINQLGMSIRCKFDEYFDEHMTNDTGKEISYWNLSGGERRTVDSACSWAFKDIKRKISGVSSNVEWLDEICDNFLDEKGYDLLMEVIKYRIERDNLSTYVISHRKEFQKHITQGEVVNLVKERGITRRIYE